MYQNLESVHGAPSSGREDNVILTLEVSEFLVPLLFVDSSTADAAYETVIVTGSTPIAGDIDSVIITYVVNDGVTGYIDEIYILGPDISNGVNGCDSVYQTLTTDRTSTSITRLAIDITDISVIAGDIFGVALKNRADTNEWIKVYSIQLAVKL